MGNRAVLTTTTAFTNVMATGYQYDAANRLLVSASPGHSVSYGWDERGNLTSDGVFTYTTNAAGHLVRAQSITATLHYTYTADGLRVAQSSNGTLTTFAWDWAAPVPEVLRAGEVRYLVGAETLGEWDGAWAYYLPDALGSVRQAVDGAGALLRVRAWEPYGVELALSGAEGMGEAQAGLGFTGEWYDPGLGMVYLRARWYDADVGRFTQRDIWEGNLYYPVSLNAWLYVYANPINLLDPSGRYVDQSERQHLELLKQDYLDSAARHNRIPTMDNNGFAALIAATILDEPEAGWQERLAAHVGSIVSGHYLEKAREAGDWCLFFRYLLNLEIPDVHPMWALASVGIGNIKLYTAANIWRGRICRVSPDGSEECIEAHVSPLQLTERYLGPERQIDIPNPFETTCENGVCESYDPSEITAAYVELEYQLFTQDRVNIEYAAAILEQGAVRALSLGLKPSAFNSVTWYKRGVQTNREIREGWGSGGQGGSAIFVLDNIPNVLEVWGLSTTWSLASEPQYWYWRRELGW